jgi:carboxyl-terminal processing protease
MLPASNKGAGMNMGFPDVCLTPAPPGPPVPIPYPNMAMHAMATPFCSTILLTMMPALNMSSTIPMTMGDQPGVANPMFMQTGTFTMGSPKVLLQGVPAITLTSMTAGNNMNNPVGAVLVPSTTNVLFTLARDAAAPASPPGDPAEAREANRSEPSPSFGSSRASLERDDGSPTAERANAAPDDLAALAARASGLDRAGRRRAVEVSRKGPVAIVAIRVFAAGVAADVRAKLAERRGAVDFRRVIFDLRGNPGGELLAAIELARDLLPQGALICEVIDAEGDSVPYRARGDSWGVPATVRVDGATASAAEVFAGALAAHGRARLVGGRTYGKGSVQRVCASIGGGAASGRVGAVVLPDGRRLDGCGLEPDGKEEPWML